MRTPGALAAVLLTITLQAAVRVEFDPRLPTVGPFPTDFLTTPDETRSTGLRVAMPLPDCAALPSDCAEIALINQLDGFNVNARLTVKFSGPVDPDTLRDGIFFVWLDATHTRRFLIEPPGAVTPVNEVVYDPANNTAHAKPDQMLESGRRYLIVVTDAVRDAMGAGVEPEPGFEDCVNGKLPANYCTALSAAVTRARPLFPGRRIAGASLYTTMAAIDWFTRAAQTAAATPPRFQPRTEGAIVSLRDAIAISLRQQAGVDGAIEENVLPATPALIAQLGVDRMAFGSFESPRLGGGDTERIYFHVFLPNTARPPQGYPVLLAGHGLGDSRFGMPTVMAVATAQGYAVVAMNAVGHGFGPLSNVEFTLADGSQLRIATPGRGVDANGDGKIEASEGCTVSSSGTALALRDCILQTVVDYRQLLNTIAAGVDFDGDGRAELRGTDIHFIGQSLGGWYGSLVTALMPEVTAAVLNAAPGNQLMTLRLGPDFRRTLASVMGSRQPSLLNLGAGFDEQMPLRYEAVKLRTTPGAAAIQDFLERLEWLSASAEPAVYGPHFKQATLGANPLKRVLIQMASGDRTVVNPSTSALARAANLRERTVVYRHDLARQAVPSLPDNPHAFLIPLGTLQQQVIGLSALQQVIEFLASGRDEVPDANGLVRPVFRRDLFEVPDFLPESLHFGTP
ncbi:MAG: alpha/beta fold hydrolase [Bryobacteraceae bacterium]